jgi:hypothetical protein
MGISRIEKRLLNLVAIDRVIAVVSMLKVMLAAVVHGDNKRRLAWAAHIVSTVNFGACNLGGVDD